MWLLVFKVREAAVQTHLFLRVIGTGVSGRTETRMKLECVLPEEHQGPSLVHVLLRRTQVRLMHP